MRRGWFPSTLFLGADTMRGAISGLVHQHSYVKRDWFSTLSYAGSKKISRMPPRSAIVGFSVEIVYAIAELIRWQRAGALWSWARSQPTHSQCAGRSLPERRGGITRSPPRAGMGLRTSDIKHVAFSRRRSSTAAGCAW
ncbi:MAG: hypothetical protein IPF96_21325 [Rhodobacter sp.]|nr:hypothetical protein [Rhodobacter sp.]